MTHPYLQHLIPDPTYGYLFPHRMTVAALAVTNEYQVKKHRPSLTEGQHWVKILGSDHIERLYYTRDGLLLLCDLTNTPSAQEFKQALVAPPEALPSPYGALTKLPATGIVPRHPNPLTPIGGGSALSAEPADSRALYAEPAIYGSDCPEEFSAPGTLATQPNHPAALVAAHLAPQLERSIERSISARVPAQPAQTASTVDLLFRQQELDLQKQQAWTDNLLKAQQQTADLRPVNRTTITTTSTVTSPAKQMSDWLNQQDVWAFTLAGACIVSLIGVGSYLMVASAVKTQPPVYQPQTQTQPWR
jgi:hypothetical protein